MTTTTRPKRVTLPVCPPWCDGHDGVGYQSWEECCEGGQQRDHNTSREVVGAGGLSAVSVGISQTEDSLRGMSAPVVDLYVESDGNDLAPADARIVAAALIEAAERADAMR